ncbi:hypothetical protein PG984_009893 [Apiospora sp. TS-2023a]
MDASPMLSAVVQSTVLQIIGSVTSYYLSSGAYDALWDDPGFRDWWATVTNLNATTAAAPTTSANNGTAMALFNTTGSSSSSSSDSSSCTMPEHNPNSLSGWRMPKQILGVLVMSALLYIWAVSVERAFPTRPRGVEGGELDSAAYPKREKVVVELSEDHEEEVVKRWIARGRVRRSSISWCNTLIKWLLDIVVRAGLEGMIWDLLMALMDRKVSNTSREFWKELFRSCVGGWIAFWIRGGPLVSFVSFVIIPAHKRIVFESAFYLASSAFIRWLLPKAAAWAIKTDKIQDLFLKQIEATKHIRQHKKWAAEGRLLDEL